MVRMQPVSDAPGAIPGKASLGMLNCRRPWLSAPPSRENSTLASQSKLHHFDLRLCDHVRGNLARDDPSYIGEIRTELDDPLLGYLALDDHQGGPDHSQLLNDDELWELETIVEDLSDRFHLMWTPYEQLYRDYVSTLPEVRKELSISTAEEWAETCKTHSKQLETPGLGAAEGISIVKAWVNDIRRYLKAMGCMDLVPAPHGEFPTPTYPDGSEGESNKDHDARWERDVELIRKVVAKFGKDAPRKLIRSEAKINNKRCVDVLRHLEKLGEYSGFTRRSPRD